MKMNKSILSLLLVGGLIFSTFAAGQAVHAQGFSFPAEMNKRFSPLSIEPGGVSRLQVTVYNPNLFELTDASWTDNLVGVQPGIFIANPTNVTNTCGGTVSGSPGGTSLSLSGGTVPAQVGSTPGSCTVSIDVTSTTTGNLINTIPAGALSSRGDGETITNTTPASATLHVGLIQAPAISKSFSPNTMLVGQVSQLTIRIRNNDLDSALTQASLSDPLPENVVLANPVSPSLSNCGSSATLSATSGGSSVTLTNATIAPNGTCVIRVNVTSSISGIYTNTIPANALHTQQGLTNAAPASANLNVQDIGITKSFSPPNFQAGGTTTLTITLRNPTSSPYTGVRLSDTLPGNVLTVVLGSGTTTCGGTVTTTLPRTVALTNGTVPAGSPTAPGTCTISVLVTAPADASGGTYTNRIPPGAIETDQNITNGNEATAPVRVYPSGGGVSANKSFTPATITAGENSRLRINIVAPADSSLTNFSITDHLPPDVTISNSQPASHSNCGSSAVLTAVTGETTIRLTNGTITAGTTCQINVYVTGSVPGVHTNIITPTDVTNNENRTIPNNITANLTIETVSDFSVSKAFTPPTVAPGGISTLTITLRNTNAVPLVNVSVTDPLPGSSTDGVIVAPVPNTVTTCVGGTVTAVPGTQTITMTGGTVPARVGDVPGTCTINVDVQGLGSLTTRRNIIPVANASGTVQGTDIVQNPARPAQADLRIGNLMIGIVKGFDPLTVFGGSASTLSVQLLNPNNVAMNGIAFADNFPEGMIIANPANPSVGTCGGAIEAVPGADSFSFSGGSLPASADCVLTIQVTMTVNGNLTNVIDQGAVSTFSGASNPDPAEASLTNLPGASISKAFTPNTIRAGSVSALTFVIQNTGTVALSGMGFDDTLPGNLPEGLEIARSPAPVNNCGGTLTAVPGTQLITLENGTLGLNASCSIVVSVTGNIQGTYTNTINAGNLRSNEGATNHNPATDRLTITGTPTGGSGGGGGGRDNEPTPSPAVSGFLIPVTGFQANVVTDLRDTPRETYAATGDVTLDIPSLGVNIPIVGVPKRNGTWNVTWLDDQAGWLEGSAFPSWNGNSVLTGHVYLASGLPGPFVNLNKMKFGERIIIHAYGQKYIFEVQSNTVVQPNDKSVMKHEEKPWLTLVTCKDYDEQTKTYASRVVVRAVLVRVDWDQ
jgi:LPXTG-site transpeptidase (sortase) family protein